MSFWDFVIKHEGDRCWEWIGSKDRQGYGRCVYYGRKEQAHRVAWMEIRGPIPEDVDLHHRCENPGCVNPEHLEPMDHVEHMFHHGTAGPIINARKAHCINGHEFTQENTYRVKRKNGRWRRRCRTCDREKQAAFNEVVDKARKNRKPNPSKEQLQDDLEKIKVWRRIGLKYGVSDNAVRKWAKNYGLLVTQQKRG